MNSRFSFIDQLKKTTDWNHIVNETLKSLESLQGNDLFAAERDLLRHFRLPEFLGYDGRIGDLLLQTNQSDLDFTQGRSHLYYLLLEKVEDQISQGGPTVFLSMTRLDTKRSSTLKQDIIVRRNEIFEKSPAVWDGYDYDLRPLWLSSYGYAVLSSYGASTWAGPKDFVRIQIAFMKLDLQVEIADGSKIDYGYRPHIPDSPFCMSKEMIYYILKRAKRDDPFSRGDHFWVEKYSTDCNVDSEK